MITPCHIPQPTYLTSAVDSVRGVIPDAVWVQDWDEHYGRLLTVRRDPTFTEAEWNQAAEASARRTGPSSTCCCRRDWMRDRTVRGGRVRAAAG